MSLKKHITQDEYLTLEMARSLYTTVNRETLSVLFSTLNKAVYGVGMYPNAPSAEDLLHALSVVAGFKIKGLDEFEEALPPKDKT